MTPPINIGGDTVDAITIDGTSVSEVTVDGSTVFSAIPDSGLLHRYDWTKASGTSTVEDQAGDDDLTGTYSGPSGSINGLQAGVFDGVDDELDTSYNDGTQPVATFAVIQFNSVPDDSNFDVVVDGDAVFAHRVSISNRDEFSIFAGSTLSTTTADTNPHLITSRLDGSNSVIRVDQGSEVTGDAGTTDPDGMTVGGRSDGDQTADVVVGEILEYDPSVSGYSRSDVETYLTDKWGPF